MQKFCINENCNAFEVEKDHDTCPECKGHLVTHCPKCLKPISSHNKGQSYGCKHCGQMFKTGNRA